MSVREEPVEDVRPDGGEELRRAVENRQSRKLHSRRAGPPRPWFGLGLFGLVGWSVAVPTLTGIAVGVWIDRHHPGRHSWTLMLLFVGLALGCLQAWYWMKREGRVD